jgi:hypothetical protein
MIVNPFWFSEGVDPYWDYVTLLMKMNGDDGSIVFTDSSTLNHTVSRGGTPTISTAQSKFDGASGSFTLNRDWLTIPSSSAFNILQGDFTVECWVYPTSATGGYLISNHDGTASSLSGSDFLTSRGSDGSFHFSFFTTSSPYSVTNVSAPAGSAPLNAWTHVAATRSGSTIQVFAGGAAGGSSTLTPYTTMATRNLAVNNFSSGMFQTGTYATYGGFIDEIRITKGIARYTGSFTPPIAGFPVGG